MWYVVMAGKGREKIAIEKCRNALSTDAAVNIFSPTYQYLKRYSGKWNLEEDWLFPGYVFIESNLPNELEKQLKRIPTTVVPVRIGGGFNPIYEEERAILKMLIDENNCIRMSCGIIVDNRLIVEKGPLNNCQTYITRIDRHKRIAELGIELWKEPRRIKAGLEVRAKLTASEYDAGRIA